MGLAGGGGRSAAEGGRVWGRIFPGQGGEQIGVRLTRAGCLRRGAGCGGGFAPGEVGSRSAESEADGGGGRGVAHWAGGGLSAVGAGAGRWEVMACRGYPGAERRAGLFPLCPPPGGGSRPKTAKLAEEQSGVG